MSSKIIYSNFIFLFACGISLLAGTENYQDPQPFGSDTHYARIADNMAIGKWWEYTADQATDEMGRESHPAIAKDWFRKVDRSDAIAFALYTQSKGVLKITAQCFPLLPDEPKEVTFEIKQHGKWVELQKQPIIYPGWSSHFRVNDWDGNTDVPYRLKLGNISSFEGLIRKDPVDKDVIVVASMGCNSPWDQNRFSRDEFIENIRIQDPDLLFFSGDQNYTHDEATYGWLQFGAQFRELMKDRPTICIPDDHDVGHANIWGEGGTRALESDASDGGYLYPPSFVNMVQRQQTWNLPDPFDPTPIKQGIGVYYTDYLFGGISFAILEDRKFKSSPKDNIPKMGPRPDHVNDPNYDRETINKPGLELLGDRQMQFLDAWARDWTGAKMKIALSQTAFCGAVHLHGRENNRLLADLDSNGWPQTPRTEALRALRRARASHLSGDQHLAVVVQQGIDNYRDGPITFTAPALVNTVYGRWWKPESEEVGGGDPIQSVLPWVGDYKDGFGNKITMWAYANPTDPSVRENRGDGYGLIRLNKHTGQIVFEAWPRFSDVNQGDDEQFPGWPVSFHVSENDGRKAIGFFEQVKLPVPDSVVSLTNDDTGELIYSYRVSGTQFTAPVYSPGNYTLRAGKHKAGQILKSMEF